MIDELEARAITTARLLAIDSVEKAGSGHPGTALALAPVAHLLFQKHIRHDPHDPQWEGRDRFVLSCGHASILLYTQLFLTGYDLTIDDLKTFRALDSRTPGHPELGHTPGVETTTGPLGQGFATAVGMAMALKHERALRDPDAPLGRSPFDRRVWVLCSDGDLQEGLSSEAGALAGRHRLDNLVVIYDDNDIQIEGSTTLSTSEDTRGRFVSQGWEVVTVELASSGDIDLDSLDGALTAAKSRVGYPTLVILKSRIAWPAPNAQNTSAAHGSPLGASEIEATRQILGSTAAAFDVDGDVLDFTRKAVDRGQALHVEWIVLFQTWAARHPEIARERARAVAGELPSGLADDAPTFEPGMSVSTRDASGKAIQYLAGRLPEFWGGSADLAEPNRTEIVGAGSFLPETSANSGRAGRNVHWGVREGAMAAAMNGISHIDGSRFFAGTFLVFSDYERPAVRLASLMQRPVTYVWTHDSVALGSDGPTHQPIEHLASLRAIPGFSVVRPADAAETVQAWLAILERGRPSGLVLGRQPVTVAPTDRSTVAAGVRRGAYVVAGSPSDDDVLFVATGSEVELALASRVELQAAGYSASVVSMPCREWFAEQSTEYRESVIPPEVKARVVVEAATSFGWADVAGPEGEIVGIDSFGLSAPAADALRARRMTVDCVVAAAHNTIGRSRV